MESGSRKALVIRGARQVGKTYSVVEFGERVFGQNFLNVNFVDNPEAKKVFSGNVDADSIIERLSGLYPGFRFVPGKTLIFLDELQECPDARTALKPLVKDGRWRVVASGSLLGLKMKSVRLNPTGSMTNVWMYPMDFEEFLWALGMSQGVIDRVRDSISRCEPIDEVLFKRF